MIDKRRLQFQAPSICPVCGEDVPRNALACLGCGADGNSGWREDIYCDNGLGLPEHDFNYDDLVKKEFGSGAKPPGLKMIWWIVGIGVVIAFLLYLFCNSLMFAAVRL